MSPADPEQKPPTDRPSPQAAKAKPAAADKARQDNAAGAHGARGQFREWIRDEGAWWAASFVFHTLLMAVLMLIPHTVAQPIEGKAPSFQAAKADLPTQSQPLERFEVGDTKSLDPGDLTADSLSLTKAPEVQAGEIDLKGAGIPGGGLKGVAGAGPSLGGLNGGFTIVGLGSGTARRGGGGIGWGGGGTGNTLGGGGFGVRTGLKKSLGAQGGTRISERAVGAALNWIARHQSPDGSWSLSNYRRQCKDPTCTGPGTFDAGKPGAAMAGTALALLPFLAAGQTHQTKGIYRTRIRDGLRFLMKMQVPTGDLSGGSPQMYVHGLATITLCEAYGLTHNEIIGNHAQRAIYFIESAQNQNTGGWRYTPGMAGDTSVVGWQVMALKSAMMAGLQVNPGTLKGAKRFLKSCAKGKGGRFSYTPDVDPTPSMTAVGLLCLQYEGMKRSDPQLADGVTYLLQNLPDPHAANRNIYFWYYATQVMHNVNGPDWDTWNRHVRRALLNTQCKTGCATGSWDPDKPTREISGEAGGRLLVTSLSALTLEVYYRYLPLYKLGNSDAVTTLAAPPPKGPPPKPGAPPKKPRSAPPKPGAPPKK